MYDVVALYLPKLKTGLLNFVGERIKHVYSINFIGTVWKQSALFKNYKKSTIYYAAYSRVKVNI